MSLRDLSKKALLHFAEENGLKGYKSKQLADWVFKGISDFSQMSNLSKADRERLSNISYLANLFVVKVQESKDGTKKFLFKLVDGNYIETVLMKYKHGYTLCVSSQVGCKIGCTFCATAKGGFVRNLSVGELVGQIYEVQNQTGVKIDNIVLMGSGEPLDNYENVIEFYNLITDKEALKFSNRCMTLSTSGLVKQIRRLADENLPITLAISLHNPFQNEREKIIPIAKVNNVNSLVEASVYYYNKNGRRVTFEYALIKGENDSKAHALELSRLLKNLNCHLNIIPINKIENSVNLPPSKKEIDTFAEYLKGISVTVRRELGSDIDAACGQLKNKFLEA